MTNSSRVARAFDEETDVVVVGAGAGGFSTAAIAADRGARVVVLEKAPKVGGTTRKSAAALWLPGNSFIREDGKSDEPRDVLKFLGRLSRPTLYRGDFLRIATALGAELANLSEAWSVPVNMERMLRESDTFMSSFYLLGDGLIEVNREGRRVVNEKAPYNEHARVVSAWDPHKLRYPNMPLIAMWDQPTADRWGIDRFGNPVPAPGADPYWVVSGETLAELTAAIDAKLIELGALTRNARVDDDFEQDLTESLERYGDLADRGVDEDFHRGDTEFERYVSRRFGDGPNPLMRRLDLSGTLYASVPALGTLDTKGGPRTTPHARYFAVTGRSSADCTRLETVLRQRWARATRPQGRRSVRSSSKDFSPANGCHKHAGVRSVERSDARLRSPKR